TRGGDDEQPTKIEQCTSNKAHGGKLVMQIIPQPDGRAAYDFYFTREGDRFIWRFFRPAQHDEQSKREEDGRPWLATQITEGMGVVSINYLDGTDLIDTVVRDVGKLKLQFEYQPVDKMFDGSTAFSGVVGERLKRLARTEGFKLLKQVSIKTKGGATLDS